MLATLTHVPPRESYTPAEASGGVEDEPPPAISTSPFGSRAAECRQRAVDIDPLAVHLSSAGSYISHI